jgi:hypothetical protein
MSRAWDFVASKLNGSSHSTPSASSSTHKRFTAEDNDFVDTDDRRPKKPRIQEDGGDVPHGPERPPQPAAERETPAKIMLSGKDLQMCMSEEHVASSWLKGLGPTVDAFRESVAAFEPLKKALDGIEDLAEAEVELSARYKSKLDQTVANVRKHFLSLKRFCNRNAKILMPDVLEERDHVLQSLEERNGYLLAEQAEASQAATEVASKLQATQVSPARRTVRPNAASSYPRPRDGRRRCTSRAPDTRTSTPPSRCPPRSPTR